MKKVEELYREHRFLEIIENYSQSDDIVENWFFVASAVSLRKFDIARKKLDEKQTLFLQKTPKRWMKTYLDLLLMQGKYGECYQKIEEWENLPYISMEIEELFPELKKHVAKEMEERFKEEEKDTDYHQLLHSSSSMKIYQGLQYLFSLDNLQEYDEEIRYILSTPNLAKSIKTLTLILLKDRNVSSTYLVYKDEAKWDVIPSEMKPILSPDEMSRTIDRFIHGNNVTISSMMKQLWTGFLLSIYPSEILKEEEKPFLYALELEARKYVNEDLSDLLDEMEKDGVSLIWVEEFMKRIHEEMQIEQERMKA